MQYVKLIRRRHKRETNASPSRPRNLAESCRDATTHKLRQRRSAGGHDNMATKQRARARPMEAMRAGRGWYRGAGSTPTLEGGVEGGGLRRIIDNDSVALARFIC